MICVASSRAFSRAERPGDRSAYVPGSPGDPVQVSRRVARYTDGRGRSTELFVAKTRQRVCIILETGGGAGAGCNPLSVGLFPKGTKLTYEFTWDNSKQNRFNPDPTQPVRWGDQTWEEMGLGFFRYRWMDEVVGADKKAAAKPAERTAAR